MPREALTNSADMRFQLLDYCYGVANRTSAGVGELPSAVPEDVRVAPFDSLFEQRVFNRIVDRGFTVTPQVEAMGYMIDMVITGAKGRLAIECDGDFWHGPDKYDDDMARQRELERCGWEFFRIRESMFYADMPGTLKALWDTLDELDIRTADWLDTGFDDGEAESGDSAVLGQLDVEQSVGAVAAKTIVESQVEAAIRESIAGIGEDSAAMVPTSDLLRELVEAEENGSGGRHRVADESDGETEEPVDSAQELVADSSSEAEEPDREGNLPRYVVFEDTLQPISGTPLNTLVSNIVRIVEVEGPVLGHRLHDAYRVAYGGQRVGKELARLLNQAIELAVRRGLIVSDNPLNEPGVKPRTFRLPTQPEVVVRALGPRTLNLVPPSELAVHLAEYAGMDDLADDEVFRAVLDVLGLKRLTDNVRAVLSDALKLVQNAGNSVVGDPV